MLSSAFNINFILKLAPVLSRIAGNAVGAHFLQLYFKTSTVTPIFYLMIVIRTVLLSMRKKLAKIYVRVFGNFNKLYGLS